MLSVMIAAILSISSLRDAGARGEIADVTGRLPGETAGRSGATPGRLH